MPGDKTRQDQTRPLPLPPPTLQCREKLVLVAEEHYALPSKAIKKKKKKPATRKSFFASWFSHCNVIGRNDTSLLVHKWKPRVITSFGFWKKIYRSFPFVELNPGAIRGLDVVFVHPQNIDREEHRYRNG